MTLTIETMRELARAAPLSLELGPGGPARDPAMIGIDTRPLQGVDIVGDARDVLAHLPDASVARIVSYHFLEHVDDVHGLLCEAARVLIPNGSLEVTVPHFSNAYYYSDLTHRTPFGLYSMSYFAEDSLHRRKVPEYAPLDLRIVSVDLAFKSTFLGRHVVRRAVGLVVNASSYTQEFYEENCSGFLSCYEIYWRLQKGRQVPLSHRRP